MPETFKFVEDRFAPPAPLPSTTQDIGGFETFQLVDEFAPPQPAPEVEEFEEMVTIHDRHGKKVSVPVYDDNGKRIHRPKYDSTGKMTHNERGIMTYEEWLKQKNEGDVDWWRVAKDAVTHLAGGFTKIPGKIEKEGWMEASANIPESFLAAMEGLRMIGGGTGRFLAKPFRNEEEENKAEYEAYADFGNQIFRQLEMRKSRMGDIARMFGADELAEVYDDGIDPEVADSLSLIFDPTYLVGGGLVKVGAAATRQAPKITNKYAKKMIQAAGKAAETKLAKEALATLANPVTKTVSGTGIVGEKLGRGLQRTGESAAKWAAKHPGKAKAAQMAVGAGAGYAVAPEGRKIEGTIGGAIGGRYAFDPKRVIGAGETLEKAAQRIGGAAQAARINTVRTSGLGTVAKIRPMREEVAKQFVTFDNRVANRILQEAGKLADTAAVGAGMGAGLGSFMPTDPNNPGWAAGLGIGTFAAPAGMYSGKALNQLARVEIGRGGVPSAGVRLRIKETPDHQLSSEAVVKRFAAGLPEEQRVRFVDADRGLSIHDLANQAETVNWAMGAKRYAGKDVDLFVGNAQEVVAKTGNPFHEAQAGFYDPATNTIYLNTDAEISATTLLHEVFHPTETWSSRQKKLDTELEEDVDVDPLQDLQTDMVQTIVGTYAPDGTQMKAGLYSADELASFIDQYNSRLYPDQSDNIKRVKADIDAELAKPKPDEAKLRLMNRDIAELNARQEHRNTELAAFEALPESEKRNYIAREILSEQFAMFGESARHGIIRKARNIALKKDYFKDQFLGMEIDKLKFNTLGRLRKTLEQVGVEFDLAGNPRGDMTATSVLFKYPDQSKRIAEVKNTLRQERLKPEIDEPTVRLLERELADLNAKQELAGTEMAMEPGIEHLIAQYITEKDKLVARVSETGEVGGSEVTFKASDAAKKNADGTPKIPASVIERWAESGWVKTDKAGNILNSAGGKWQPGQRPAFTTARERTRMDKNRVAALVAALEPVTKQSEKDEKPGPVVKWRETADGGKNFSGGYFDDAQMQAIMDTPDDVVRPAFKEKIKSLNEAVKSRLGQPFLTDYWKAISGRGYDSKARMKVQLFTPIGMQISSAGNFSARIFNIGYLENKINRWLGQSGKKKFWSDWADADGRVDVDAFRRDMVELLGTHYENDRAKRFPEGTKKEKLYSFIGVKPEDAGRQDWNRSVKDRKQIQLFRVDRMQNLTPGMGGNFPIDYGKAAKRYMPGEPARPPVDDLGFYSRVAEVAASDKIPARATGEQMLATIAKQPGVKKEEIAWLGLEEFLRGKDRVTKEELGEFIRENDVRLEETVMTEQASPDDRYQLTSDYVDKMSDEYQVLWDDEEKSYLTYDPNGEPMHNTGGDLVKHGDPDGAMDDLKFLLEQDANRMSDGELLEVLGRENKFTPGEPTQYGEYQLPGAEPGSYREMVLRLPEGDNQTYQSSHWNEPNVLAHVRFNDRTGPNGEKILFVEEVQSDWHREGRERGYAGEAGKPKAGILKPVKNDHYFLYDKDKNILGKFDTVKQAEERAISMGFEFVPDVTFNFSTRKLKPSDIPDAPFKTSWHELAMKRMLRHAAENGYDKLAWIDGEETAFRYDLSKQVDALMYLKRNNGSYKIRVYKKGNRSGDPDKTIFPETDRSLEQHVGKEVASRIIKGQGEPVRSSGYRQLEGLDLKIGGEWAYNLYDRMIPQFMKKYGKKWGAKVEDAIIPGERRFQKVPMVWEDPNSPISNKRYYLEAKDGDGNEVRFGNYDSPESALDAAQKIGTHGQLFKAIDITPAMRGDEAGSVVGGQVKFMPGVEKFDTVEPSIISESVKIKPGALDGIRFMPGTAPRIPLSQVAESDPFIILADRMADTVYEVPGSGVKIELHGGPGFSYRPGDAVWASTKNAAKKIGNYVERSGKNRALIMIQRDDNHAKNPSMGQVFVEELKAREKNITKTDMRKMLRAASKRAGLKKSIKNLEELDKIYTFWDWETRGDFFGQFGLVNRPHSPIGDPRKRGFFDYHQIIKDTTDPELADLPTGAVVGAIEFDGGKTYSASELGTVPHSSYDTMLKGRGLGLFETPPHISDILDVPETQRSVFTLMKRTTPPNRLKEVARAQADKIVKLPAKEKTKRKDRAMEILKQFSKP